MYYHGCSYYLLLVVKDSRLQYIHVKYKDYNLAISKNKLITIYCCNNLDS